MILAPLTAYKPPSRQGEDKRSLVVKLCRRDLKRELISASKRQQRPSNFLINESLSPLRQNILYSLRRIRSSHPNILSGCTSIDGRIFAYTKPPDTSRSSRDIRHLINTKESLQTFCNDYIKRPLEEFVQNWSL